MNEFLETTCYIHLLSSSCHPTASEILGKTDITLIA